jgi:hypothetical protein
MIFVEVRGARPTRQLADVALADFMSRVDAFDIEVVTGTLRDGRPYVGLFGANDMHVGYWGSSEEMQLLRWAASTMNGQARQFEPSHRSQFVLWDLFDTCVSSVYRDNIRELFDPSVFSINRLAAMLVAIRGGVSFDESRRLSMYVA